MVTMADVARQAQVSVSTVSHVLNRTRKVNADTQDAVAHAVRELGYVHNTLARALARSRTNSIGVALTAALGIASLDTPLQRATLKLNRFISNYEPVRYRTHRTRRHDRGGSVFLLCHLIGRAASPQWLRPGTRISQHFPPFKPL